MSKVAPSKVNASQVIAPPVNTRSVTRRQLLRHFRAVDPRMAELIELAGPYRLQQSPREAPFRYLARAIIAQQISSRAANTIIERMIGVCAQTDQLTPRLNHNDYFPSPSILRDTPAETLRSAGVSRAKVIALHDLAEKALQGLILDAEALNLLDDQKIIEDLTIVRGVGPWTVQMMLMFQLGRADIMAATDYGVRKGFMLWYRKRKLPTPGELARYGERWAPFRSAACWYLWRALELKSVQDA
jgi:DNA-3-methyladenine glycosylase II